MLADLFAQLFRLPAQVGFVFLAVDSCIRLAALVTVPRDRLPSAGLAWLMAIFLLPVVGGIAYLVIGRSQLPQRRRENQTHASRGFLEDTPQVAELVVSDPNPTWLGPLARMMRELGAAPLLGGARVEVVLGFEDQVSHLVRRDRQRPPRRVRAVLHAGPRLLHRSGLRRPRPRSPSRREGPGPCRLPRVGPRLDRADRVERDPAPPLRGVDQGVDLGTLGGRAIAVRTHQSVLPRLEASPESARRRRRGVPRNQRR